VGVRKNQASLTPAERAAFVAAVKALKANGQYDVFVQQHRTAFMSSPNDPAHNGPGFLPWHREYLRRFERALQAIDPSVSIPYWDWTVDRSTTGAPWTNDFMGGNGSGPNGQVTTGPFAHSMGQWTITVNDPGETRPYLRRGFGLMGFLPTAGAVTSAQMVTPYDSAPWNRFSSSSTSYRRRLEVDIHNPGHMWVGGSMMDMSSPNDPVFWLHHCNIDRLWAEWQRAHPTEGYLPPSGTPGVVAGHALDDPMPPWQAEVPPPTPKSVLVHSAMGYTYDTDPPVNPPAQGDDMQPGEVLNPGQSIKSASGRYTFVYQTDGNLVLYDDGTPLWASATDGRPVGRCIMQSDGNLVIYGPGGQPFWSSNTWQHPGSRLVVQDDGNVVIYRPDGTPVWATNTWLPTGPRAQGDDMQSGEVLNPGQSIASASGRYTFVYQTDGNLVLYDDGTPLWASATDGQPVGVCIMQSDGNLVIYARNGLALWASNTWQHSGSRLVVQDDGNVVIYRPDGTPVWATNTWLPTGTGAQGDDMQPGEVLNPGQSVTSANSRFSFTYQGDGNLVLYDNSTPLWASATDGQPVGVCIMQTDGNLVIYARGGLALWASNTWQHPGSRLVDQDDGNVVIYRPDGTPVWATGTARP
jgi:outer membrane lipoprotein-sorting protein